MHVFLIFRTQLEGRAITSRKIVDSIQFTLLPNSNLIFHLFANPFLPLCIPHICQQSIYPRCLVHFANSFKCVWCEKTISIEPNIKKVRGEEEVALHLYISTSHVILDGLWCIDFRGADSDDLPPKPKVGMDTEWFCRRWSLCKNLQGWWETPPEPAEGEWRAKKFTIVHWFNIKWQYITVHR